QAVFLQVGVVGVARTEGLGDFGIVLAALVGVADQQADGGAGGPSFVDTRKVFDLVFFLALGHVAAGAGAAPVEVRLDIGFRQVQPRGATVNHAADGRPVRFAEIGDREKSSEGVA